MSGQRHYRDIIASSSMIGGSALVNILIGMVRAKFVAVLLGPSGVGLMGMLTTIVNPISAVAGMGIATSGVRQVTNAVANEVEGARVAEVMGAIRLLLWAGGLFGGIVTVLFAPWLSLWTFKTPDYTTAIAIMGVTVLMGNVALGPACLLQGQRRIGDLARISIWGAVNGAVISIPCFYFLGLQGVVLSLVLVSLANLLVAWFYARRIEPSREPLNWPIVLANLKTLLGFGVPVMLSGFQAALMTYFLRWVVLQHFGLDGVGIWGAAFNISGILVGFVLNAMGTEYYPRLACMAHDNNRVSFEVNTQTEIALLLSAPALLITILFAPLFIELLYSGRFDAAIPILRWSVYGVMGRVVAWPMGFIILAQGRGKLFFVWELFLSLSHIAILYMCASVWGLKGTGIAFLLLNVINSIAMAYVAQKLANTHWSYTNMGLIARVAGFLTVAGVLHLVIKNTLLYYSVSIFFVTVVSVLSLRKLAERTGYTLRMVRGRFGF